MVKYAAILSLGLGLITTGLFGIPLLYEPPAYSRFTLNTSEMRRQAKYLDEQIRARSSFMAFEDEILHKLAQGQLSLTQACDRLYQHACQVYPRYLRFLRDPKTSLKERMARNCIEILRLEAEDTRSFMEAVPRLERELAGNTFREWCKDVWLEDSQR
ncbi:MAG TPA: hypothetical protein VKE98_13005 [Gemmataceae bacterium]|nr:hypothetical protein [Gemmataceae bacterium]